MDDKKSEISFLIGYCCLKGRFPMRVSDSSVGGGAGQFCALCDVIPAAERHRQQ